MTRKKQIIIIKIRIKVNIKIKFLSEEIEKQIFKTKYI
jgi:hypothetical protein